MAYERKEIPASEIRRQEDVCREIFDILTSDGRRPLAMVDTYGCQQNESDNETITIWPLWAAALRTSFRPTSWW